MLRKVVLKQLLSSFFKKNSVYNIYEKKEIIYIHVPKVAGTSICDALYGEDPWHFSAEELKLINAKKFKSYSKVVFVRNPIERLISTYLYSKKQIEENPNTSISFMKNCLSFDDFIEKYLNQDLVNNHYFFWTQDKYAGEDVDFIGKFENLPDDFERLSEKYSIKAVLPHKNKSQFKESKLGIKKSNFNKIIELYKIDFQRFDYDVHSDKIYFFDSSE